MKNSSITRALIAAGILVMFLWVVLKAWKHGLELWTEAVLDTIALGIVASLAASTLAYVLTSERLFTFEHTVVALLTASRELGLSAVAKRGKRDRASSIGRTMVPEDMLRSATREIAILAYTAHGTVKTQEDIVRKRVKSGVALRIILLDPNSNAIPSNEQSSKVKAEIAEVIGILGKIRGELSEEDKSRVQVRLLKSAPTFTATAIDAGIDSEPAPRSTIGAQPRIEGKSVHSGMIIEVIRTEDGLWHTFRDGIRHYWEAEDTIRYEFE